jgi:hypothetical protein
LIDIDVSNRRCFEEASQLGKNDEHRVEHEMDPGKRNGDIKMKRGF